MFKLSDGSTLTHDRAEKVGPAPQGRQPFKQTFYWNPPFSVRRLAKPFEKKHSLDQITTAELDDRLLEMLLQNIDREAVTEEIAKATVGDVTIDWDDARVRSADLQGGAVAIPVRWTST